MRFARYGMLALGLAWALSGTARAKSCSDDAAVAAARRMAAEECDCTAFKNHGQYVKCVGEVVKQLADTGALPTQCKGDVMRCAANSICGKPGFVTCCRVQKGRVKCSIKSSEARCLAQNRGNTVACVGSTPSCCDACGGSGGSAGGGFVCQGSTTSTTATTSSSTAAPTTSSSSTAAPTTSSTSSSTAAPTTTTTSTLPGSPSAAFVDTP